MKKKNRPLPVQDERVGVIPDVLPEDENALKEICFEVLRRPRAADRLLDYETEIGKRLPLWERCNWLRWKLELRRELCFMAIIWTENRYNRFRMTNHLGDQWDGLTVRAAHKIIDAAVKPFEVREVRA